jgi:hypothetical protein
MVLDMTLKAIIHEAVEGGFWAEVPALPGLQHSLMKLIPVTEDEL